MYLKGWKESTAHPQTIGTLDFTALGKIEDGALPSKNVSEDILLVAHALPQGVREDRIPFARTVRGQPEYLH